MATFTLSAADLLFDVLEGTLALALDGAPVATLELPEDAAPELGPADLLIAQDDDEPVTFRGTLVFARPYEGRCSVTWVGGAGGLGGDVLATHYTTIAQPVQLATVVDAIVAAAGELLADGALGALAGLELPRWTRVAGETWGKALSRALEGTARAWRILDTGLVWIGAETWPEAELGGAELDEDLHGRVLLVAYDRATLRPGTSLGGRHVVRVTFGSDGRADAELDDDAAGAGGIFARLVARHSTVDPYAQTYLAEVVTQHADQTLDLRILEEDAEPWRRLPFNELTKVPFWSGVQGARYVIPAGAHVNVGFRRASPAGAIAFGRPSSVPANRGVARKDDSVDCGTLTAALVSGAVQLTYVPAGGGVPQVGSTVQLTGVITSASGEVFLQ